MKRAIITLGAIGAILWIGCGTDPVVVPNPTGGAGGAGGAGGGGGSLMIDCPVDCSTIAVDQCAESVCDTDTGLCTLRPRTGDACDDGLFCTVGDLCEQGECVGFDENDCGLAPDASSCQRTTCDEATESCALELRPEGSPCTSTDLCEIDASCTAIGTCEGVRNSCVDAIENSCQTAFCDPTDGSCVVSAANQGLPCVDTGCSTGGTCNAGACVGATLKDCSAFADACNAASCNATTGACEKTPINNGGACTDDIGCTIGDTCNAGACVAGAAMTSCANDDGCCPAGCNSTNDDDCHSILLFGDDLAASGWQKYRNALVAAGQTWDEIDYDVPFENGGTFPNTTTLDNYDTLIMVAQTFTDWPSADNLSVVSWLQSAADHNLLVIGKDVLDDISGFARNCEHDPCDVGSALTSNCTFDVGSVCSFDPSCCTTSWTASCVTFFDFFAPGVCPNGEFDLYELLGARFEGSAAGFTIDQVVGVNSDPITDAFFTTPLRLSEDTNSSGDFAQITGNPATPIASYSGVGVGNGYTAITRYAPSYQAVWVGFSMHDGLLDASQRNELMVAILEWFEL